MRILQLTSTSAMGGTEQMVLALAGGLNRLGHACSIFSLAGPATLTQAAAAQNIDALTFDLHSPFQLRELQRIRAAILERRVDLIHTYGLQADVFGRLLRELLGKNVRLVCGIRSIDDNRPMKKVLLDRYTSARADLFISNSEAGRQARIRRERIPARKIDLIYNGIDITPIAIGRQKLKEQWAVGEGVWPVIVHVANLRPMKGHETALGAARIIARKFLNALFLFAGRDDSNGMIPQMARDLGVEEHARFLGFCPRTRELLAMADVMILPSSYEGCPVSILEAMAEGCPVVASNVGGIPELVRNETEALLVQPGKASELAGAIERIVKNTELRRSLIQAARERVEKNFTVEKMVEGYERAYLREIHNL